MAEIEKCKSNQNDQNIDESCYTELKIETNDDNQIEEIESVKQDDYDIAEQKNADPSIQSFEKSEEKIESAAEIGNDLFLNPVLTSTIIDTTHNYEGIYLPSIDAFCLRLILELLKCEANSKFLSNIDLSLLSFQELYNLL